MLPSTGAMMNRLRNRARPASTWFGGVCCSPSALRVSPRTTRILVKLVQVSRIAGSSESSVIAMITVTEVLGLLVRPDRSTVTLVSVPLPVPAGPFGPDGPGAAVGLGSTPGARTLAALDGVLGAVVGAAVGVGSAAGFAAMLPSRDVPVLPARGGGVGVGAALAAYAGSSSRPAAAITRTASRPTHRQRVLITTPAELRRPRTPASRSAGTGPSR